MEIKNILEEQLKLLRECSQRAYDSEDICSLNKEIRKTAISIIAIQNFESHKDEIQDTFQDSKTN